MKRHKRSLESNSKLETKKQILPYNEIFQRDFSKVIKKYEISIIIFADVTSSICQAYFPILEEIERRFNDVYTYTIDCTNYKNYYVCFDEIINGVPLINFYSGGERIVRDFYGESIDDFVKVIKEINDE